MNPSAGPALNSCYALTDRIAATGMGAFWAAADTVVGGTDAVTAKLTGFDVSALPNPAAQTPPGRTFATASHLWQVEGRGQSATASNDIYALGTLGDEMPASQGPFITDSLPALAVPQLNITAPRPETVPRGIRKATVAAPARDRAKASAAVADMARGLHVADAVVVSGARVASPVAAFSPADTGGARTPGVTATTAAPPTQNRATPSTTTESAPPSKDSHTPGHPTISQAAAMGHHQKKAMDHHQKKDGKQ